MPYQERKISKEIYENAQKNGGYLTDKDKAKVFDVCELCGYGIYGAKAYEEKGKYFCIYYRGSSCD